MLIRGGNGPVVPPGWELISAADFNADGKPDYLLLHPSTRQTALWYLDGTNYSSGAFGPPLPSG